MAVADNIAIPRWIKRFALAFPAILPPHHAHRHDGSRCDTCRCRGRIPLTARSRLLGGPGFLPIFTSRQIAYDGRRCVSFSEHMYTPLTFLASRLRACCAFWRAAATMTCLGLAGGDRSSLTAPLPATPRGLATSHAANQVVKDHSPPRLSAPGAFVRFTTRPRARTTRQRRPRHHHLG
jgi:hypothetical protein